MSLINFTPLIILFVYLLIIVFAVYFLINVLQFMKKKNKNDELLLQKVDEVSQKLNELEKDKGN